MCQIGHFFSKIHTCPVRNNIAIHICTCMATSCSDIAIYTFTNTSINLGWATEAEIRSLISTKILPKQYYPSSMYKCL